MRDRVAEPQCASIVSLCGKLSDNTVSVVPMDLT